MVKIDNVILPFNIAISPENAFKPEWSLIPFVETEIYSKDEITLTK